MGDEMNTLAVANSASFQVVSFPSGTVIVAARDRQNRPWLDIHAGLAVEKPDEEGEFPTLQKIKYRMADEVAACLNGGPRPAWLSDMRRDSESRIIGADGSSVTAIGPTQKDESHPNGWIYREDQESQDMRARLIDLLWFAK